MTSVSGAYGQAGARLVERGYAALPIIPGTKRPGVPLADGSYIGMDDWAARAAARLPIDIEVENWSASDAGVCAAMGAASGHTIASDVDTDIPEIVAAIMGVLPYSPVAKAGQKGETLFYRSGPGFVSRSFDLPVGPPDKDGKPTRVRVLDLLGSGKQSVLPPTIHPDTGQPYRWTRLETLESVSPEDLPWIDEDIGDRIAEALKPFGYAPEPERPPRQDVPAGEEAPHRRVNDLAMADLGAWVPDLALYKLKRRGGGYVAVPSWRPSHTGRPLERRGQNLKIHPDGIRDFHDGDRPYTPLDLVMAARGCELGEAFDWLAARVGYGEGVVIDLQPRAGPVPEAEIEEAPAAAGEGAEQPAPTPPEEDPAERLTHVPGLLGEVTDWIVASARRPNRLLALGSAIVVLGTLVGRRWAGPTMSGTHLYVVGLAPTGAGKDHPVAQIARLMEAATARQHIGPDEFMSMPAVINMLLRMPLSVCAMDEFGAFLKGINGRKAGRFEQGITKTLRSAWGRSFDTLMTPEWAGKPSAPIKSPALSIFGVSTAEEFYGSLEGGDIVNGVLNRFLVLRHDGGIEEREPEQDRRTVPEWLADALEQLFTGGNPLGVSRLNDSGVEIMPLPVTWQDEAAKAVYDGMQATLTARVTKRPDLEPFIARTAEMAVRLATIRAIARTPMKPQVDVADMQWGRDLALLSAANMARDATLYIAETDRQQWSNRILRLITRKSTVTVRQIQQMLKGALRSGDIKDILGTLVEAEAIEKVEVTDPRKDTVRRVAYRIPLEAG